MTQTKAAFNQINGNVVSVLDYGAVGDDTTDNTSAIQSSVIYAANNGKTLYIPKGIYKINGTITIPAIGLKIVGDGVENSIIRQTSTTLDALKTDPSITRNYSGLLQDFSIFMPDNATGTAIEINNPNGRYEINRVNIDKIGRAHV